MISIDNGAQWYLHFIEDESGHGLWNLARLEGPLQKPAQSALMLWQSKGYGIRQAIRKSIELTQFYNQLADITCDDRWRITGSKDFEAEDLWW